MRIITTGFVGLAALGSAHAARADGDTDPVHKNILLIVGDDIGPDKLSGYAGDFPGYAPAYRPFTLTLDTLANRGVRFTRAWATPMCSSTRVALETGLQPSRTGIGTALGNNAAGLDPAGLTMLAQVFAGNGYATGKFGKHHMGTRDAAGVNGFPAVSPFTVAPHPARLGWQRFFGSYDGYLGTDPADPDDGYWKWKRVSWLNSGTGTAATENAGVHATDRTEQVALDWINSRTTPWLAVVDFNAGHSGTTASSTWTYDDADPAAGKHRTAALSCLATRTCTDEARQVYQGLVEHMDIKIANLLSGMDLATLDNTLILFIGDNGTPSAVEESSFAQLGRGKGSTYENGVRVPLIVTDGKAYRSGMPGPTIPVLNRDVVAKVNTLDIFNTVIGLAFFINLAGVDSRDFTPCLTVNDTYCGWTARYGYTELFPSNASPSGAKMAVSWREDTLVSTYDPVNACMTHEYYDTSTDPLESAPLLWTGIRATRLQNYFTTLHTGVTDWANPTGAAVVPFCP